MTVRVSGKNLDIGDALRAQVVARVGAALAKYCDGSGAGHVVVSRDGIGFKTECVVSLGSGVTLEAAGLAPDAYASFDQSALRIEKRLRRHKRRLKDRLGEGRGGRANGVEPDGAASAYTILAAPEDEEADEAEYHPVVIAETTRALPTLPVSEAVLEMDLTGAGALVFRHAGHGRVNVVYRRADGTIGWVDPPAAGA